MAVFAFYLCGTGISAVGMGSFPGLFFLGEMQIFSGAGWVILFFGNL